jgi:hypothetical protein
VVWVKFRLNRSPGRDYDRNRSSGTQSAGIGVVEPRRTKASSCRGIAR